MVIISKIRYPLSWIYTLGLNYIFQVLVGEVLILTIKSYFYQIYKIIFLLLLTNISNLYAHNLFNGGCKEHCGQKVKVISNKNKLKNINDRINIESKNSCLNKSLCRG